MLRLSAVNYEVVDLGLGYNMHYLNQRIKDYQPDAVGISMMTFRYKYMYYILEEIRKIYRDIKIIAGGSHITAWRTKVLEQCPAIDFGISREGEFTIRELCQGKELSTIKGLIFRDGNDVIFNGERELINNLDTIHFPTYDKFECGKYSGAISVISSRGCPYQCVFCQSCSMLGKKWRARSATNIADEIQFWYEKGYRNFSFADDNFTMDKKRIYQLCEEIEKRHLKNLYLSVGGVRVDLVDRDLLKRMREVGFYYVAFGIEAGNNKVLRALKKGFTIEQAEQGVRDAIDLGFDVKLYFQKVESLTPQWFYLLIRRNKGGCEYFTLGHLVVASKK
ncbi:radical SAM protein [bacterium]|nr:radical SAM protein [bacterium]